MGGSSWSIGCCSSTALSDAVGMPDAWCQNGALFCISFGSSERAHQPPPRRGGKFLARFRDMTYFFHHDHWVFWALAQALFRRGGVTLGVPFNSLEYSQCWKYQAYLFEAEKCIALLPIAWNSPSWKHSKKSLTVFDYILCGILWVIPGEVVRTDSRLFRETHNIDAIAVISNLNLHPTKKDTQQDFFWVTCVNPPPLQKKTLIVSHLSPYQLIVISICFLHWGTQVGWAEVPNISLHFKVWANKRQHDPGSLMGDWCPHVSTSHRLVVIIDYTIACYVGLPPMMFLVKGFAKSNSNQTLRVCGLSFTFYVSRLNNQFPSKGWKKTHRVSTHLLYFGHL